MNGTKTWMTMRAPAHPSMLVCAVLAAQIAVGCGPTFEAASRDALVTNASNRMRAIDEALRAHHLRQIEPERVSVAATYVLPADAVGIDPLTSGLSAEWIARLSPADDGRARLGLVLVQPCNRCDPCPGPDDILARAPDGSVYVVRLDPNVHEVEVGEGSCGFGCGQPPPPEPPEVWALPVDDASQVHTVVARYDRTSVTMHCTSRIPAP